MSNCNDTTATTDSRPQVPKNWNSSNIRSQKGKIVIVTGANSGIGYETALELARKGAHVTLACRSECKGKEAEANLTEALAPTTTDAGSVEFKLLDVSDLSSVQKFADEFKATHDRLDLLINNAGVMAIPYSTTADGFECQFATNHLGHFALTARLFPLLKHSAAARVVNVSSLAHRSAKLDRFVGDAFTVMRTSESGYNPMEVYEESKLSNLLFTFELDRRLRALHMSGVLSVACHPGLTGSNLMAAPSSEGGWFDKLRWRFGASLPIYQDVPTGALPTLYAATAADVQGNDYYGPGNLFEFWGPPKRVLPKPTARNEAAAAALWTESEQLTGLEFDLEK